MAKELPKLTLNPLDELFSTEQDRSDANLERVQILRCEEFDSFPEHPFKVREDAEMAELIELIRENGVLIPCIARPKPNGRYEMISGHRRRHAAIRLGIESIPCIVRNLDDAQATALMVLSNKHRPYHLPSEKAKSYKMLLDSMKAQGKRTDLTSTPLARKLERGKESAELIGESMGDSKDQVRRYIRLTYLLPEILQMVDNSVEKPKEPEALSMAMRPAVELSYLTPENQRIVLGFMQDTLSTPSHAQAIQLRKMQDNGILTAQEIYNLLSQEKPNQKSSAKISMNKFSRFFPPRTSAEDMEKEILKALDFYMRAKEKTERDAYAKPEKSSI